MAIFGRRRPVPTVFPSGNIDQLPIELDISKRKIYALGKVGVGVVVFVAALVMRSQFATYGDLGDAMNLFYQYAPIVAMVIGAVFAGNGVLEFTGKRVAIIDKDTVTVSGKSLLGSENWTEALSAYSGVRWRTMIVYRNSSSSNRNSEPYVYQILELKHNDAARNVTLYVTRLRDHDARAKWEHFAKLFNIPAIDERDGQSRVRAADDVDKSIKELAQEGKVESDWETNTALPNDILMTNEQPSDGSADTILITLLAKRGPIWLYGAIFGIGALIAVGTLLDAQLFGTLAGIALCAGVGWMWKSETNKPRTVRITRSSIEIHQPMRGSGPKKVVIEHSEIESIYLKTVENAPFLGKEIVIATDNGDTHFGTGISRQGHDWLKRLLVSAIAEA